MKKALKIIIAIIAIIIIVGIVILIKKDNKNEVIEKNYNEEKIEDNKEDNKDESVNSLKEEYKITGDEDIYEVIEDTLGRKMLTVKANINLKVAFAGMVKKSIPQKEEIDTIYEEKFPKKTGIYIDEKDRKKIVEYLNTNKQLKNSYKINEDGSIKISEKNDETELDKKIEKIMNSNKTVVISINGICYMVDSVTGEIVDNPYVYIDKEQTYEYFEDENKIIVFITDNEEIDKNKIFEAVLNLLYMI